MEPVRAAWRRWLSSPVRDVVSALVVTAVLISGTYGEAHPSSPSDTIQFRGRLVPHPPPVANRRAYVASIHDRAEEDARRRVDEERLRIARELHDVVAHTMATINVQAGAASHVLSTRPEAAAEALQAIKAASKEGLRELRAILNVLRQADDADPTHPAPATAQLETLVAGAAQARLAPTPTLTRQPPPRPAP